MLLWLIVDCVCLLICIWRAIILFSLFLMKDFHCWKFLFMFVCLSVLTCFFFNFPIGFYSHFYHVYCFILICFILCSILLLFMYVTIYSLSSCFLLCFSDSSTDGYLTYDVFFIIDMLIIDVNCHGYVVCVCSLFVFSFLWSMFLFHVFSEVCCCWCWCWCWCCYWCLMLMSDGDADADVVVACCFGNMIGFLEQMLLKPVCLLCICMFDLCFLLRILMWLECCSYEWNRFYLKTAVAFK